VRFWDASAIVPLVALEKETGSCRTLLAEDTDIVVWFFTPVEVLSALSRRLSEPQKPDRPSPLKPSIGFLHLLKHVNALPGKQGEYVALRPE